MLGAALFATGGAAIEACALGGWAVASLRSGIAALALLALAPAARRGWGRRHLAVGCAYAATMILFVLANKLTTAASTIFLQSTAPLWVMALAPRLLGERARTRDLALGLAMAAGLALCLAGGDEAGATAPRPRLGNALAALSGLGWALTILGLRRVGTGAPGEGLRAVVAGNGLAFVVALPFALPLERVGAPDVAVLVWLGVFQIGAAYLCVTAGLRAVPALEASLLLLVEPVLNPLFAWLAIGERPGAWTLGGGALILAATLAHVLVARRPAVPRAVGGRP